MRRLASLVAAGVLLGGGDGRPAPAPVPRKARGESPLAGRWVMYWGPSRWVIELRHGGFYRAVNNGTAYLGRWCADGRRLTVTETPSCGGSVSTWSVRLDGSGRGVVDAGSHRGTEVRLEVIR